jgi:hypothetical protein
MGRGIISTLATATLVVALIAPSAGGFWGKQGSAGAGSATVAAAGGVQITAGTPTAQLFPTGAATGDLAVGLTNVNPFPVRVPRLALDVSRGQGGFAVDAAHAECSLSSLSYATQANGGAGWQVPAFGSLSLDLTKVIALTASAPDACQGASFTVYLTSA